jgi:hypothetical protein
VVFLCLHSSEIKSCHWVRILFAAKKLIDFCFYKQQNKTEMKNGIKLILTFALFLSTSFGLLAQNQYEAFKNLGEGTFRVYSLKQEGNGYTYYYDYERPPKEVTFENTSDIASFLVKSSVHPSGKTSWVSDKDGYPTGMVTGNIKHPKVKYLKNRTNEKSGERILVVDGAIVRLSQYKSPTDFTIAEVWKKGGKLSKLKALKEAMKTEMKMKNENWPQKVEAYLKKEVPQQDAKIAKWKSANPSYEKQLAKDKETWKGLLNWSREEQRKIDNSKVTITNKLSYPVYYKTKSGASRKIRAGSFERVDCSLSTLYRCNSAGGDMTLLLKPSEYCGKSYFIK